MPSLGETFRVNATITDLDGTPVTAGVNLIELYEPDSTLNQSSAAPTHIGAGVWTQNFTTAAADPVGSWVVVWTITAGGATGIGKLKGFIDDPPIQEA